MLPDVEAGSEASRVTHRPGYPMWAKHTRGYVDFGIVVDGELKQHHMEAYDYYYMVDCPWAPNFVPQSRSSEASSSNAPWTPPEVKTKTREAARRVLLKYRMNHGRLVEQRRVPPPLIGSVANHAARHALRVPEARPKLAFQMERRAKETIQIYFNAVEKLERKRVEQIAEQRAREMLIKLEADYAQHEREQGSRSLIPSRNRCAK